MTAYMSTRKANAPAPEGATQTTAGDLLEQGRQAYMRGDFAAAIALWRPLAETGSTEAQCWMGSLYANGEGVAVDDAEALKWYLLAAEGGSPAAQANVGAFYGMGRGTSKDVTRAAEWLKRAAEGGDPNGLFNLAVLYSKGEGVGQDLSKAAQCYLKAAERGHYPSQSRLGHLYAKGIGVERDSIQAYVWLTLAGSHGIGSALQELETVAESMSSREKAEAQNQLELRRSRTDQLASEANRFNPVPD